MGPFYAMDTCFYSSQGSYGLDARCEMLRELGYDAAYLTLLGDPTWKDLPRLADVARRNELSVAGVWVILDIAVDESAEANRRVFESAQLYGGLTRLELALKDSSDPDRRYDAGGDDAARALIERLLECVPGDVEICLYPHINAWLERFDQAIELCERVDDDRLGACFPSYHWYAVQGAPVEQLFERAGDRLRSVNICGSRRVAGGGPPTIEPLDAGELDNFALLGSLERHGYRGPVGLQGYSLGGDSYAYLQRSLAAYHSLTGRLAAHPEWAVLRPTS